MLFLLDQGWALVGAAVGLLLGVLAQGIGQTMAARSLLADRQGYLAGRHRLDLRRHLDPFGVVVALIANPPLIWGKAVPFAEPRFRQRGRYVATCLVGSLAHLLVGMVFLVALLAAGGGVGEGGILIATDAGRQVLAIAALVNLLSAVLRLIPLPPLDGARILWLFAPRTEGWRKARYWLEEQNVGLVLLIALLLPIFGDTGLLLRIVLSVTRSLLGLLAPVF